VHEKRAVVRWWMLWEAIVCTSLEEKEGTAATDYLVTLGRYLRVSSCESRVPGTHLGAAQGLTVKSSE